MKSSNKTSSLEERHKARQFAANIKYCVKSAASKPASWSEVQETLADEIRHQQHGDPVDLDQWRRSFYIFEAAMESRGVKVLS